MTGSMETTYNQGSLCFLNSSGLVLKPPSVQQLSLTFVCAVWLRAGRTNYQPFLNS